MQPKLIVESGAFRGRASGDHWLAVWHIQNLSDEPVDVLAARLPHSRFRAEEKELAPTLRIEPGGSGMLELSVSCRESPGTVVENAFLILRMLWHDQPWRLLARLCVTFDSQGTPQHACEVVTLQPIGFSGLPLPLGER